MPRMRTPKCVLFIFIAICAINTSFASQKCLDAADEPHHRVIFENKEVRILQLELARLQSTSAYCYAGPVVYVVPSESRTTRTSTGYAGITHDWMPGEARFVAVPLERTVRNETNATHREIIVETHRKLEYNLFRGNQDVDEFPAVRDSNQPTWSVDFARGSLSAQKTQLAAGDRIDVGRTDHLLIALDGLQLTTDGPKKAKEIRLSRGETATIEGGAAFTLTNSANSPSKFILVDF
jgi:hypothetical protein